MVGREIQLKAISVIEPALNPTNTQNSRKKPSPRYVGSPGELNITERVWPIIIAADTLKNALSEAVTNVRLDIQASAVTTTHQLGHFKVWRRASHWARPNPLKPMTQAIPYNREGLPFKAWIKLATAKKNNAPPNVQPIIVTRTQLAIHGRYRYNICR